MLVFVADDGQLEALHAGQTARSVMVRRLYFFVSVGTASQQRTATAICGGERGSPMTSFLRWSRAGVQLLLVCRFPARSLAAGSNRFETD